MDFLQSPQIQASTAWGVEREKLKHEGELRTKRKAYLATILLIV